ncbi:MAG TPA: translocation/assembly module TamB domain-containing protein [Acetobacteraceae bacterium]|nr:translocation/assembly module TamB domain-containing protein [Acetobacteraceae bacterium]
MRRALKILAWVVGLLIGIPVLLVGAVLIFANVPPGQRMIAGLVPRLTGGTVTAQGLSGTFPGHLRLAHAALRDTDGVYATLDGLALDWSPLRLLAGAADIQRLAAAEIHVLRLPVPSKSSSATSSGFALPVRIVLDRLAVDRLMLDKPVAGVAVALAVTGSGRVDSLQQGRITLALRRLDAPGTYKADASLAEGHITATLAAQEPAQGLIAHLAALPDLGPLDIEGHIAGPKDAEATELTVTAGPLKAAAHGTLDLAHQAADLTVAASAPAMTPRPDTSWQSVALDAHVQGPFTRPDASGTLTVTGLVAGGAEIKRLTADVAGNAGQVRLKATIDGLHIPGPQPDLLAAAPVTLTADATLDAPDRPITFALQHPLLSVEGRATAAKTEAVTATVNLPALAPFARIGGVDLAGSTRVTAKAAILGDTTDVSVDGTLGVTGGMAPVPGLIGPTARIGVTASLTGGDITVSRAEIDGRTLTLAAHGTDRGGALDLAYQVALSDLAVLAPTLSGHLAVGGTITGRQTSIALTASAKGEVGAPGVKQGPVTAEIRMRGLPGSPSGQITAGGTLLGAPLRLAAAVEQQPGGAIHAAISQADWKTLHAAGDFTLPKGAKLPLGQLTLRMSRLADLAPLVGQPVTGSLQAAAQLGQDTAHLTAQARNAGIPGTRVASADIDLTADHPLAAPSVQGSVVVKGIAAGTIGGDARIDLSGPESALGVKLAATLRHLAGADARITGAAVVDVPGKQVRLDALRADWHDEPIRLLAPVRISFAKGLAVDRLRVGIQRAVLEVAGRISPTLDLTASARDITPDLAHPFVPSLAAQGIIAANARLTGSMARPGGTIRLTARGLRLTTGPGRALPAADLTANVALAGTAARIDARLVAGSTHLTVTGTAPIPPARPLDLRATGALNLAMLDPILTPSGRQTRGTVTLNTTIGGTLAAPRIGGSVRLVDVSVQDYAQGAHLTAINGSAVAEGQTIRLDISGRAGPGTIGLSGTVGPFAPGLPVDLRLVAHDARPLASDSMTVDMNADLTVRGEAETALNAAGTIHINRAEIRVPEQLPTSVAVLHVIQAGQKPAPPAPPPLLVHLDITVDAPGRVFVRGRGLDAELSGRLHVGGTSVAPQPVGGFNLRYGTFSLVGTTLTFSRGHVGLGGAGLEGKIDPTLDFEANSTSGNITATLDITGYADKPKITLSSSPTLPQDEILARLLFGKSAKDLSPFEYAEIAQALAQITGVGGPLSNNPLNAIRQGLGLDRLQVTGGANGAGAAVEAGRYVAPGVFVGAKQGTSGGSQAEVQIDLWKGLKLDTTVGTSSGTGASAGSSGSSVGLSYQFEY